MATKLYINTNAAAPKFALVKSLISASPVPSPAITVGDQLALELYLVDGLGAYDAASGAVGYSLKLGIGLPGLTPAAFQDTWTPITNGWSAKLECNTAGVVALLGSAASVAATLEIELTDGSGNRRTIVQAPCTVLNAVIDGSSTVPTPTSSYLTAAETTALLAAVGTIQKTSGNPEGVLTCPTPSGMAYDPLSLALYAFNGTAGTNIGWITIIAP